MADRIGRVHPAIMALCEEFEIKIISSVGYPDTGETRATATLERILRDKGEGHLRIVLSTLIEAGPNGALLDGRTLMATSDLVTAFAGWIEEDLSSWYEAWDQLPIGEVTWLLRSIRGLRPAHRILLGALYVLLQNMRDGNGMDKMIRDTVDRRLFDIMKRPATINDRNRATATTLGRTIVAAQKHIAPEAFPVWLFDECGIDAKDAKRFVKLAMEADAGQSAGAVAVAPAPQPAIHEGAA